MEETLKEKLAQIGDKTQPREYYLNKYNYSLDKKKHAIPYWKFDEGKGIVQSSKPETKQ